MSAVRKKREYVLVAVAVVLFISMSTLSLISIGQLQGNARVVNYVGIVRGATQRLVKKELQGHPDDALIKRLDAIIEELITGEGSNDLIVLQDKVYLDNMAQVKQSWGELKSEIVVVRGGKDNARLFDLSETYFDLVDRTVSSAEQYSERQVQSSTRWLIGINSVFIVLVIIGLISYFRSVALKKRTEVLGKIAYQDSLTQMPNRAGCDREIDRYTKKQPKNDIAVFMYDINSLKHVNDVLGNSGGDRLILDFAKIMKKQAAKFGFAGRYGGDEFITIFPNADEALAQKFLERVDERIIYYNLLCSKDIEKISVAVGYVIGNMEDDTLENMIEEASHRMHVKKQQMKEHDKE